MQMRDLQAVTIGAAKQTDKQEQILNCIKTSKPMINDLEPFCENDFLIFQLLKAVNSEEGLRGLTHQHRYLGRKFSQAIDSFRVDTVFRVQQMHSIHCFDF